MSLWGDGDVLSISRGETAGAAGETHDVLTLAAHRWLEGHLVYRRQIVKIAFLSDRKTI